MFALLLCALHTPSNVLLVLLSKADLDWQIFLEKRLDQLTSLLKTLSRCATVWSIRVWQFLGNFNIHLRMLLEIMRLLRRDLIWFQVIYIPKNTTIQRQTMGAKKECLDMRVTGRESTQDNVSFLHISSVALLISGPSSSEQYYIAHAQDE